jgi:hypothetical protein
VEALGELIREKKRRQGRLHHALRRRGAAAIQDAVGVGGYPPIRPYVGAYGPASHDTIFGPIMSPTPSAATRHRAALRSAGDERVFAEGRRWGQVYWAELLPAVDLSSRVWLGKQAL